MKEVYCPCCRKVIKNDHSNKSSLSDHGRCHDCQAKWQQGELPDQIKYPIEDWQYQVKNGDTKLSYGEWVEHCTECDEE